MNIRILPIMALVQQASAEFGTYKVWMTVTNTKINTVKTMEWTSERFLFEKNIPINVDHLKEEKIKQTFGTTKFTFTWQIGQYESTWHHFKVTIGTKAPPSTTLRIAFI